MRKEQYDVFVEHQLVNHANKAMPQLSILLFVAHEISLFVALYEHVNVHQSDIR